MDSEDYKLLTIFNGALDLESVNLSENGPKQTTQGGIEENMTGAPDKDMFMQGQGQELKAPPIP